MDFTLSSEQQALAESVARFCERDYGFAARNALIESCEGFSRARWATFAELGWLGAGLSEAAGGFGGGPVETMVIAQGFGRALVLEPFLATAVLSLQTLAALPSSEARDSLVAAIVAGERLVGLAHGEPPMRGALAPVETVMREGRISGVKSLVLGAPDADALIVSAHKDGEVILYLVDPAADGVQMTSYRLLDNSRAGDIRFDNAPVLDQLATGAAAVHAIETGHAHALVGLCAQSVSAMDGAVAITRDYLKTRQQFGATLNTFQALQHRMADMFVETELSRSILYQGMAALDGPSARRTHALSAMKAVVSAAAMFVGRQAVQLHGGIGITEEYPIGHYYRALFVAAGLFGSEDLHLGQMAANPQPFWT